jgi:outer membrane protein assembly factor BamB
MDPYQRSIYSSSRRNRRAATRRRIVLGVAAAAVVALVVVAVVFLYTGDSSSSTTVGQNTSSTSSSSSSSSSSETGGSSTSESTGEPGSTPTTASGITVTVAPVEGTRPADFDITTHLYDGGTRISSYDRPDPIDFGPGKLYTSLEGIITFRGNNYREGASYGTAAVKTAKLSVLWSVPTGSTAKTGGGSWTGSGWTGQPLIVKWPDDLKQIMNLKDAKKTQEGLVEVIYPCLDGRIYFLDLKDGTATRAVINSGGGPFKGTGSIYPDGTPILFVGHGDNSPGKEVVRARLYSLIDQKLLYTFGKKPDPNSYRKFHAYDSSALFDVESDTIIEPGENGVLYTIKLNTKFDKEAGTLTVDPDPIVKINYTNPTYKEASTATLSARWWGFEDSAVAWHNYLYVTDNGGKLFCWDLNTMKLVWVQSTTDDSNSSPVFEESPEDGTGYLYVAPALKMKAKGADPRKGGTPIFKINASTGEIVWQTEDYTSYTVTGVSGGVQGTPVLGRGDISDLVIFPVARSPNPGSGILVALDKETGKEVWRMSHNHYAWSSPVAVYTRQGKSYIVLCDTVGQMFLVEGTTGKVLDYISLGTNIEAAPAVFGNTIVVGTRGQKIFAVTIN